MELTEAQDIKKRWQEYTEELYKKDLHDPDNHYGVITDLEPDILECEVKWALITGGFAYEEICKADYGCRAEIHRRRDEERSGRKDE